MADKAAWVEVLERLAAENDARLAEPDERIVALQWRVRALADVEEPSGTHWRVSPSAPGLLSLLRQ